MFAECWIDGDDDLPQVWYIELMNEHSFGIFYVRVPCRCISM